MTDQRTMFVSRFDRLDLAVTFDSGTYEVPLDLGLVAEYLEIIERYESLMRKLWDIYEEGRMARLKAIQDDILGDSVFRAGISEWTIRNMKEER